MATLTYYLPAGTGTGLAYVTAANSSTITVEIPSIQIVDNYTGSFTYAADGTVAGGTLYGLTELHQGQVTLTITDINTPAAPVAAAVLAGRLDTALDLFVAGNDSVAGSTYGEAVYAGAGNDTVIALDGDDSVVGWTGNDDLNGNKGNDIVLGGDGADTVRGGQGEDTVFGDAGDDPHVNGNIGNDIVRGGTGNDTVFGGQGTDTLYGDDGNDLLSGDLGNGDILYGGAGADRFAIGRGGGFDWAADFNAAQGDRIQLAPGTAYTVTDYQGQVVIDLGNGDELGLAGVPTSSFSSSWIVFG